MTVARAFINLTVETAEDMAVSRAFYEALGFVPRFTSGWFVHLAAPEQGAVELGLLLRSHETVPSLARAVPGGVMLTVVVPDVDAVHRSFAEQGVEVLEPPRDLFYGQRRMVVRAPEGTAVDISSECAPDPEWMARVGQAEDGSHYER